jgi:hypothetical protein
LRLAGGRLLPWLMTLDSLRTALIYRVATRQDEWVSA